MDVRDKDFQGRAEGEKAIEELGMIVREREKTRRLLIGAACLFFIVAALVVVFAPKEKETLSYILGAALVIMALGAIGAAQFRFKLPGGIDVDSRTLEKRIGFKGQKRKKTSPDDNYRGPISPAA